MSKTFAWTDREVRRALGLALEGAQDSPRFVGVSTDSRTVKAGDLYVALVGERFDGHNFVVGAFAAGALGAVVSAGAAAAALWGSSERAGPGALYVVEDTLVALGRLATHRRNALSARVVGITGSSGKTGTKDLTAAALSSLRVHASKGNLNNRVGLPLTLLSAPADTEVVVAEMGTNEPGEIATLAGIARPEIGVVTTVGESHLEGLGSIEGVLAEKLSMLRGLTADKHGLVGDTPPELPEGARKVLPNVRVAGWTERADAALRPADPVRDERGAYSFGWRGQRVSLSLPGRHAVTNALLALGVTERLGVEPAAAAHAISSARPGWMRGEVLKLGKLTLLLDCYNANPQSTLASIGVLEEWQAPKRVALLGSMLELGAQSGQLHRRVLADVLARKVDLVVASGSFALAAAQVKSEGGARLLAAEQPATAYALLREQLTGDEVVLLKGSRGVALEKLIPLFEADFGAGSGAS